MEHGCPYFNYFLYWFSEAETWPWYILGHDIYWDTKYFLNNLQNPPNPILHTWCTLPKMKNWSHKSTERCKQYEKNSFKQTERIGTYVSIHWWSICLRRLSFSSKRYFLFSWQLRSNNVRQINKTKLIMEVRRAQQTMWQELIQTDREMRNLRFYSLVVYLSL